MPLFTLLFHVLRTYEGFVSLTELRYAGGAFPDSTKATQPIRRRCERMRVRTSDRIRFGIRMPLFTLLFHVLHAYEGYMNECACERLTGYDNNVCRFLPHDFMYCTHTKE